MGIGSSDPGWEDWRRVINAIEDLLPYYERVNSAATFFLLPMWRERVAELSAGMDRVLEIGPGTGGFSWRLHGRVTCVDPSIPILAYSRAHVRGNDHRFVGGIAEELPFGGETFDGVFCSFSFRDFLDKRRALEEMLRVLRPGGRLHILDIAQPPEGWRRKLLGTWIEKGVPLLATLLIPASARSNWRVNPYWTFTETYVTMRPPQEYAAVMGDIGFDAVRLEHLGAKAAFHLEGVKPRTT